MVFRIVVTPASYNNNTNIAPQENTQQNKTIDFTMADDADSAESGKTSAADYSSKTVPSDRQSSRPQIAIVSSIGICSLVLLLITKFFPSGVSVPTAVISRLRDFVSAAIGFLVSCGRTE